MKRCIHEPNENLAPYHWPESTIHAVTAISSRAESGHHDGVSLESDREDSGSSLHAGSSQVTNLKSRSIAHYVSQGGNNLSNWLQSFREEGRVFLDPGFSDELAPLATATVSSVQRLRFPNSGVKAVDQRLSGVPFPPTNAEWITHREWNGAWIRLTWPTPVMLSDIALYDRPNLTDNILTGTADLQRR